MQEHRTDLATVLNKQFYLGAKMLTQALGYTLEAMTHIMPSLTYLIKWLKHTMVTKRQINT
jgi:hypothetical protein